MSTNRDNPPGFGEMAVTCRGAMLRGAAVAALVAALVVSFAVAWAEANSRSEAWGTLNLVNILLFRAGGEPPLRSFLWPGALYVLGAAVIGCATGALARRLTGSIRRRALILVGISPLGPWLLAAVVVAAPPLSDLGLIEGRWKALGFAAWMSALSLPLALPYVVLVAPLVAPPVVLGHLMLEGWTRPAGLPATGFARASVRQAALKLLVIAVTALVTFSVLPARG